MSEVVENPQNTETPTEPTVYDEILGVPAESETQEAATPEAPPEIGRAHV